MKTLTTRYGAANGGQGTAQVTEWIYDPMRGWMIEKLYPGEVSDQSDHDYSYTAAGRLQTRRWERGVITTYTYAPGSGDLVSTSYSDATRPLAYRYTRWGAVKEIDDYSGTREFIYRTTLDLSLERESQSTAATTGFQGWAPKWLFHAHDTLGRRTGLRIGGPDISAPDNFAEDHVVQYGYDPQTGRLKDIVHGDTDHGIPEKPFVQSYLPNSHLPSVLSKPVGSEVNSWEPYRDVLKSKDNRSPFATSLARSEYGTPGAANDAVNAIGQRTETNYSGSYILSARRGKSEYAYNANGEVVSAVRKNTAGTPLAGESDGFTFDPIGNRLAASIDGTTATTYAPNPLNQYASIVTGGSTFTPLHDADGNLVNDGIRTYQWDGENRLEEVRRVSDNTLIARYSYDYMSRRVYKATTSAAPQGATATVFMYDGWNLLAEYPAVVRSIAATTPAKRTYTWGLDLSGSLQGAGGVGGLLAMETKDEAPGNRVAYPYYDGNGNVLGILDELPSVLSDYEYDAFGNLVFQGKDNRDNPFRFSTKYFDKETGFYYYGYRYYDPVTGRWPSRDPIVERGGINLYCFTHNDAIHGYDYMGLSRPSTPKMTDCSTCFSAAAHKAGEEALKKSEDEFNSDKEKARKARKPFEGGTFPKEYGGRVCLKVGSCGEDICYTTIVAGKSHTDTEKDSKGKHMGTVDPSDAPECEKGDRQIGWWHTHPGNTDGKGGFGMGPWMSPSDLRWVDGLTNGLPKHQNPNRLPLAMTRRDTRTGPETFIYNGNGKYWDVAEVAVAFGGIDPLEEGRGQDVGEHHGVAAEGLAGQRFAKPPHPGLKPAAGSGKNVRRKVGQDGLLLHNYNYRTSAGFPSPVPPEKWLNPVPFGSVLNGANLKVRTPGIQS